MKYAVIPIEIKTRELDARLLLAAKIVLKGEGNWSVVIGDRRTVVRLMFRKEFAPYIFISKGMFSERSFFDAIRASNGKFTLLDEEGGVTTRFVEENFPRGGVDNPCVKYVEKFFFWGQRSRDINLRHNPKIQLEQIAVTGHPRFDLCKPVYDHYFTSLAKLNNSRPVGICGRYILINTAFVGNNNIVPYEIQKECLEGDDQEMFRALVGVEKLEETKLIWQFMNGLEDLFQACPDMTFLLRPHPAERAQLYVERFDRFANVYISKTGNVQEVMRQAACIIHHGCTTAVEGFLNKKPVICFLPAYNEQHTPWLPMKVSSIVSDSDSLIDSVRKVWLSGNWDHSASEIEKMRYGVVRTVIENIEFSAADRIFKHLDEVRLVKFSVVRVVTFRWLNSSQTQLKRLLRNVKNSQKSWNKKKQIEMKAYRESMFQSKRSAKIEKLDLEDISTRLRLLGSAGLQTELIEVEDLGNRAFFLRYKKQS